MLKSLIFAAALAFAGCAGTVAVGPSPEAQIKTGAETITTATTLATVALREHRITVVQAKSYRNMLAAAGESLKDADVELLACRAATRSTAATKPDPCWPKVQDVVTIALQNITAVRNSLSTK